MTRLIVQDGERRRAFRVREGKLTIGSGAACTLRLESADVAEIHAELELKQGRATLIPRPGVVPPSVGGRPAKGPTALPDGARIAIGSAEIQVRYGDEDGGEPAPASATRASKVAAAAAAAAKPRTPTVRTSRPLHEVKRGTPVPVVLSIVAVALIAAVFVGSKLWNKGAKGFDPSAAYGRAVELHNRGEHARAELELAKLAGETLTPDLRSKVKQLQQALAGVDDERAAAQHDEQGREYMDTQLVRFEKERLSGDPPPEAVRVFLKRCRHFRQEWPNHPGMEWVDRHEGRFRGFVNLADPPTYKDIEFEIKTMTWAMPRDYRTAFAILDDFERNGPGEGRTEALALRDKLNQERDEYFLDRMQQAAWLWERDQRGEAVEWLVQLIVKVGDADMEAEAARELIALPGIENLLRAYQGDRPETFEQLVKQELVRELARENGLI